MGAPGSPRRNRRKQPLTCGFALDPGESERLEIARNIPVEGST
jgi:hypothetical protein